jgi:hypothetical protein
MNRPMACLSGNLSPRIWGDRLEMASRRQQIIEDHQLFGRRLGLHLVDAVDIQKIGGRRPIGTRVRLPYSSFETQVLG